MSRFRTTPQDRTSVRSRLSGTAQRAAERADTNRVFKQKGKKK